MGLNIIVKKIIGYMPDTGVVDPSRPRYDKFVFFSEKIAQKITQQSQTILEETINALTKNQSNTDPIDPTVG